MSSNLDANRKSPEELATLGVWTPWLLSVLRLVTGLLFLAHGVVKLFGFPADAPPGQVLLFGLYGLACLLELRAACASLQGCSPGP